MINEAQAAEIRRIAEATVEATTLETEAQLQAAVSAQLARLTRPPVKKRHATVLALAEAAIAPGGSRDDVFTRQKKQNPDIVNKHVFYSTNKSWFHDPTFREVLETVELLYRKWAAGRATRDLVRRQQEWEDRVMGAAGKMIDKATAMLDFPLAERTVNKDGKPVVIRPGPWSMANVAPLVTAADKLARTVLDMESSDRSAVAVSWEQGLVGAGAAGGRDGAAGGGGAADDGEDSGGPGARPRRPAARDRRRRGRRGGG
jgi:hypothetical protein